MRSLMIAPPPESARGRRLQATALVALLLACWSCAAKEESPPAAAPRIVAGDGLEGFSDQPPGRFRKPIRLAGFPDGSVAVADIFNHAVRRVWPDGRIRTLAGGPERKGHRDGPSDAARFKAPHGVAVLPDGSVVVAEAGNHTLRLLRPTPEGAAPYQVTTLAGSPGESGFRDGPADQALFSSPHAVIPLPGQRLLIADIGNGRLRLFRNGRVSTVAGTGEQGHRDGPALEATLHFPMDLSLAEDGAVLVADAGSHLIRRFADGRLTTIRTDRPLNTPHGVAAATGGRILVAEMGAHRISLIDPSGHVTTIFGSGAPRSDPQGLNRPAAVLVHHGLLWIADLDNHRLLTLPWR